MVTLDRFRVVNLRRPGVVTLDRPPLVTLVRFAWSFYAGLTWSISPFFPLINWFVKCLVMSFLSISLQSDNTETAK